MPQQGTAWMYEHVCISGEDNKIVVSCGRDGTTVTVNYYWQAATPTPCDSGSTLPYSYPQGSVIGSLPTCDQQSAYAWATDPATYAARQ